MASRVAMVLAAGMSAARAMQLTGDCIIVIASNESTAVQLALSELQVDLYRVLGYAPVVLSSPPIPGSLPNTTAVLIVGSSPACPWLSAYDTSGCYTGWESHCVKAIPAGVASSPYPTLIATGSGDRGAIFAAYALSEGVLGVNPWWRVTDDVPTWLGSIQVQDDLALLFAPPQFKYRAVFTNDEDLLGGLRADALGNTVFDLATWNDLFSTMLRLKVNTFLVGTVPFPDEDSLALAFKRGLVIVHHHFNLLGINTFKWPLQKADWDWKRNTATMAYSWQGCVAAQAGYEVLWSVGLRGLNDYAYPCASTTDCGAQISSAIGNQTAWVRAAQPNADIILYLWDELLALLLSGDLIVPPGVLIVFADAGAGFIQGGGNLTRFGHGLYYHTAMLNGFANQMSEMVPADRIFAQLGLFVKTANATTVFIDNVSDFKSPMTTEATLRLAWDPTPYISGDPNATAREFYTNWTSRQLHVDAATAASIADIWIQYFLVPYIQGGEAENLLATRMIVLSTSASASWHINGSIDAATVAKARSTLSTVGGNASETLAALLATAQALRSAVPASRQGWYDAHNLVQLAIHAYGVHAVISVSNAVLALSVGQVANASVLLTTALADMDAMFAAQRNAESSPRWSGLYFFDRLVDMQRARSCVRALSFAVSTPAAPLVPVRPIAYYQFYDYQTPANFPFLKYNSSWHVASYVRINCVLAHVDDGTCANSPTGGAFVAGSHAAVTMQILNSETLPEDAAALTIFYTLDGSEPNENSSVYTAGSPIVLAQSANSSGVVNLHAMAWLNGSSTGLVTAAVYNAW